MTMSEVLDEPGGRLMVLQCLIEEMQDGLGKLSQNRPFIEAVIDGLTTAGVLTEERLYKRGEMMHEKIARCEPPFERPFLLVDPYTSDESRKVVFWPLPALERAMKAMDEGVFLLPQ